MKRQQGWIVFGLLTFVPPLQTGSLKMDQTLIDLRESFDLFQVNNETYRRVTIMESSFNANDSLNIQNENSTDNDGKVVDEKFSLSLGQQLTILVCLWLLASLLLCQGLEGVGQEDREGHGSSTTEGSNSSTTSPPHLMT